MRHVAPRPHAALVPFSPAGARRMHVAGLTDHTSHHNPTRPTTPESLWHPPVHTPTLTPASAPRTAGATTSVKYNGVAGYGSYTFTRKLRGALRVENFDDKDGARFGVAGTKYREVTATGAYLAADNFEARAEVRRDQATNAVFRDYQGAASKTLMTIALQGLYKF